MQSPPSPAELTLENCDREPIHIPGSIQPHGALLAFDRLGRLSHASANVPALLGLQLEFGRTLRPDAFGGDAALRAANSRTRWPTPAATSWSPTRSRRGAATSPSTSSCTRSTAA